MSPTGSRFLFTILNSQFLITARHARSALHPRPALPPVPGLRNRTPPDFQHLEDGLRRELAHGVELERGPLERPLALGIGRSNPFDGRQPNPVADLRHDAARPRSIG